MPLHPGHNVLMKTSSVAAQLLSGHLVLEKTSSVAAQLLCADLRGPVKHVADRWHNIISVPCFLVAHALFIACCCMLAAQAIFAASLTRLVVSAALLFVTWGLRPDALRGLLVQSWAIRAAASTTVGVCLLWGLCTSHFAAYIQICMVAGVAAVMYYAGDLPIYQEPSKLWAAPAVKKVRKWAGNQLHRGGRLSTAADTWLLQHVQSALARAVMGASQCVTAMCEGGSKGLDVVAGAHLRVPHRLKYVLAAMLGVTAGFLFGGVAPHGSAVTGV